MALFFVISFFVPEIFKFPYYAKLATDDIIGCASVACIPPPYFCSCPIFRAGKTPKTPFFALCSTETLATQVSASTVVWHKIKNISTNNEAMLLKLGRDIAPYEIIIPNGTHFDVALATCMVPVSSSLKSMRPNETQWDPMNVGLACALGKTGYFALLSRKW